MCLREERLELCVGFQVWELFPPIFNIIDEDAGGGNDGDGSVKDLRRSESRVVCLCKACDVGDLRTEGLDGSVGVVGGFRCWRTTFVMIPEYPVYSFAREAVKMSSKAVVISLTERRSAAINSS